MRKLLIILAFALLLGACADDKTIDGVTYEPYGLINQDTKKNDSIHYEIPTDVIITSVLFCETLIVPVYNVGFAFWEPVGKASEFTPDKKGVKIK